MRRFGFVALMLASAMFPGPLVANPSPLNALSTAGRAPQIVAHGPERWSVVWQGDLGGRQRVLLREFRDGDWSLESPVDNGLPEDHILPTLSADRDAPCLAWVRERPATGGARLPEHVVCLGRREGGVWDYWEWPLAPGELCVALSVAPDGDGGSRVAAQIKSPGRASRLALFSATADGRTDEAALGAPTRDRHYPMLFDRAAPEAMWYRAAGDGFELAGATPGGAGWAPAPFEGRLPSLDADKRPLLVDGPDGALIGVWHDPIDGLDHIRLSREGDPAFEPERFDDRPDRHNRSPHAAIAQDGAIAVVWVGDTPDGSAVFARVEGEGPSRRVSKPGQSVQNPRVAFGADGALLIVWHTNEAHSGAGHIHFREIPR